MKTIPTRLSFPLPRFRSIATALGITILCVSPASAANVTWNGASTDWDINTSPNWIGGSTFFNNGDQVTFANVGVTAVTIAAGGVSPASTLFAANAQNYTFAGAGISGGTLTVNGGIQTLTQANGYAGATTVNGGTLRLLGTTTTVGSILNSAATVNFGGTLHFDVEWPAGNTTTTYTHNRYGDATTLTLKGGTLRFGNEPGSGGTFKRHIEQIGTLQFSGESTISLLRRNGSGNEINLRFTDTVRQDRGHLVMTVNDANWGNATNRYYFNATTTAPTVANDMVAAHFIGRNASVVPTFLTYKESEGGSASPQETFAPITYTDSIGTSGALIAGTGTERVDIASGASTLAGDANYWALRTQGSISGSGTLSLGSGGLIIYHASINRTISPALGFGSAEGVIYASGGAARFHTVGNISGTNGLTKAGDATLALSGNNDWTGLTQANNVLTVNSGILRLDGGSIPADGWVHVAQGGTFSINALSPTVLGLAGEGTVSNGNAASRTLTIDNSTGTGYTFGGVLADGAAGKLNLIKSGSATQTLTGASTLTGAVAIDGGTLRVNGSIGAGDTVQVNGGGTLAGTGSIQREVAVHNGGRIAPGNSIGVLTNESATWNGGGIFELETKTDGSGAAGVDWDQVQITADLDLSGSGAGNPFILRLISRNAADTANAALAAWDETTNHTWTDFVTFGSITGFAANKFSVDATGFASPVVPGATFNVSLSDSGNSLNLNYVIPEPGTLVLVGLALLGGAFARRRRA